MTNMSEVSKNIHLMTIFLPKFGVDESYYLPFMDRDQEAHLCQLLLTAMTPPYPTLFRIVPSRSINDSLIVMVAKHENIHTYGPEDDSYQKLITDNHVYEMKYDENGIPYLQATYHQSTKKIYGLLALLSDVSNTSMTLADYSSLSEHNCSDCVVSKA